MFIGASYDANSKEQIWLGTQ